MNSTEENDLYPIFSDFLKNDGTWGTPQRSPAEQIKVVGQLKTFFKIKKEFFN